MRKTEIIFSSRELSKKERVAIKNEVSFVRLDKETENGQHLVIIPDWYVILEVTSDTSSFKKIIVADKNGVHYTTGSETFMSRFADIFSEMEGEEFELDVYSCESKKYAGKYYITCDMIF